MATLLEIIQSTQRELGLPVADTVIGNSDLTTTQMLALLQAENDELRQRKDWTDLTFEYNLPITPPITSSGDVTENSPIITNIPDTSQLVAQFWVPSGANIPPAARIISVDSATQVTMSMEATGTLAGGEILFAQDTYPEPDGFDHFINRTWWDRTNHWELLGPDSAQIDQWHRSGIVATGPRREFRQIGPYLNTYRLWPAPFEILTPIQAVFEYITKNSIRVNGSFSSFAATFANDADVPILDSRAYIMGLKWRFWEQKGFNWASKRTEYDNYVERLMARDGGAPTLSLVRAVNPIFISPANVQDGFFPGPTGSNMS